MYSCRYSPDSNLLKLQKVARDNHLGSIWSGPKKNIVLGGRQEDFTSSDESLKSIESQHLTRAERSGFPLKYQRQSLRAIQFQPWHERRCKKTMETATRTQFKEHKNRLSTLPYGFIVDMKSEM